MVGIAAYRWFGKLLAARAGGMRASVNSRETKRDLEEISDVACMKFAEIWRPFLYEKEGALRRFQLWRSKDEPSVRLPRTAAAPSWPRTVPATKTGLR